METKTKLDLFGYYNERGYVIETVSPVSGVLYRAGNHALDSQQDGTGTQHQLPIETIKEYCQQTGEEMAEEQGVRFAGLEHCEGDINELCDCFVMLSCKHN